MAGVGKGGNRDEAGHLVNLFSVLNLATYCAPCRSPKTIIASQK